MAEGTGLENRKAGNRAKVQILHAPFQHLYLAEGKMIVLLP